jgi:hypothetical protein
MKKERKEEKKFLMMILTCKKPTKNKQGRKQKQNDPIEQQFASFVACLC